MPIGAHGAGQGKTSACRRLDLALRIRSAEIADTTFMENAGMPEHLRAKTRGFNYPIGDSLTLVREAGGLSRLTPDQISSLVMKRVEIGECCDDMPADSAAILLARGDIEVYDDPAALKPARKRSVPDTTESEA
jgi:hypothetical protein